MDGRAVVDPELTSVALNAVVVVEPELASVTLNRMAVVKPELASVTLNGLAVVEPDLVSVTLNGRAIVAIIKINVREKNATGPEGGNVASSGLKFSGPLTIRRAVSCGEYSTGAGVEPSPEKILGVPRSILPYT